MRLTFTRTLQSALALGTLLALVGCPARAPRTEQPAAPSAAPEPQTELGPDGEAVTPGAMPASWPDSLPPYPGATIIEGREVHDPGGSMALTALLETTEGGQEVADYYAERAAGAGYRVLSSSRTEIKWLGVYERPPTNFVVTIDQRDVTKVELRLIGLPLPAAESDRPSAPPPPPPSAPAPPPEPPSSEPEPGPEDPPGPQPPEKPTGNELLPAYPGSERGQLVNKDGMITLNLTTAASSEEVQSWYRDYYVRRGLSEQSFFEMSGQTSTSYSGPQGDVTVLTASTPAEEGAEPTTRVHLSFKQPSMLGL